MSIYNPVYYYALLVLALWVARSPLLQWADASWHRSNARTIQLDGLRGILVVSVVLHHLAIYHAYAQYGVWQLPPSHLFTQAGQASVALFFMLTGYLFWAKIITAQGYPNWRKLLINRYFRIAPMSYFSSLLMLLLVFSATGWQLQQPLFHVIHKISPLLLAGFYSPESDINSYHYADLMLAGVTWTLRDEWLFYLLILPISALIARQYGRYISYPLIGLVLCSVLTWHYPSMHIIALMEFFAGMFSAALQTKHQTVHSVYSQAAMSLCVVILLFGVLHFQTAYLMFPTLLLIGIFLLISKGCTLFGLLTTRPAVRLGELSFSIYMLQGIVLYIIFNFSPLRKFALGTVIQFWLVSALALTILILVSMLTHVVIEKPGIAIGKNLSFKNE